MTIFYIFMTGLTMGVFLEDFEDGVDGGFTTPVQFAFWVLCGVAWPVTLGVYLGKKISAHFSSDEPGEED